MILVEPIRNGKYVKDGAYWLSYSNLSNEPFKIKWKNCFSRYSLLHIFN
nr:hypothetical protein [Mycoplasmopsis bovis]